MVADDIERLRDPSDNINTRVHWDDVHRTYVGDRQIFRFNKGRADFVVDTIRPGDRLLDVGCAEAFLLEYVCIHRTLDVVVGIDISPVVCSRSRSRCNDASFVAADVNAMPFASSSFDYIVLSNLLEHTDSPALILHELFDLLKVNGRLFVDVPYMMRSNDHQWLCNYQNMLRMLFEIVDEVRVIKHPDAPMLDMMFLIEKVDDAKAE